MTSNLPAASPDRQVPGTSASGICKRPGCENVTPARERGRTRVFCSDDCARRYHNDARLPAAAAQLPADSSADPLTALDALIRQAAVLTRTAREQAAGLDPARVRAQIADAEAARRRAEAATVTAEARAAEAAAETQALAEALDAAREDTRAAQAEAEAARAGARAGAATAEQARADAADRISAAQASAAAQVTAARTETDRCARERDDAAEAARRAEAEAVRARQAEDSARAETDRVRADAARERDTLREQHQAQLDAVAALTVAERGRAERAEQLLETERTDRRHLTTALTAPGNGNGKQRQGNTARVREGRPAMTGTATAPAAPPIPDDLDAVLRRMRFPYLRKAAPGVLATARAQRWDPAEVVRILLEEEIRGRDEAGRRIRRKAAGLPAGKTFASWREDASSIPLPAQHALMTLEWVTRAENLCIAGPSGTGKSHFAEALAHKAIDAGMRVAWFTLESLTAALGRAAVDGTTARAIARITRCDLVAIDDIGMLPAGQAAAEALYRLVDAAYERRSLIVTSNLHPSGLDTIMPKTLATATVDRLLHHAHLILTEGTSLRLAEATAGKGVTPLT